jgi:membrane-bound serine protease (ClpP class)
VGQVATAKERLAPEGQVLVHGEIWRAVAEGEPVEAGARVRVIAVNGLTLKVAKADTKGGAP